MSGIAIATLLLVAGPSVAGDVICVANARTHDGVFDSRAFVTDTPVDFTANSDLEAYVSDAYYKNDQGKEIISSCWRGDPVEVAAATMRREHPETEVIVVPWSSVVAFSKATDTTSQKATASKAPTGCLTATREALYMRIRNKCDQRIEVAFCYKSPSEHFSCASQQFGQQGVDARNSAGVSLPDTEASGTMSMIGCIAPAYPVNVHFDGKRIRSGCG